jgi:uncharacterized membrane protein YdjX (TVP38/TMEM64 family)
MSSHPTDRDPHGSVPPATSQPAPDFRPARLLPLAALVILSIAAIMLGWHRLFSPAAFAQRHAEIETLVAEHRAVALALFAGLYALAVALSLPGAVFLTIIGGILFGTLSGAIAALVGASAGATVIFLVAKSALGGWLVRRAGPRAERLAAGFRENAFNYLLFLRLVPLFPFWLVNLVPALFGMRLGPYLAATILGIIPATFAFACFGAGVGSAVGVQAAAYRACLAATGADCSFSFDVRTAATPQLIAGLIALGLLALVPVVVKRLRSDR